MGQRENVSQRKHLAPATATPAKAADTQALAWFQNTPGRGEKGQIHPSCTVQGKQQGVQWQESGAELEEGPIPGAARLPGRSVVPAAGSGHTLGTSSTSFSSG